MRKIKYLNIFVKKIYPTLKTDLYIGGIGYTVERFLKITLFLTLLLSMVFTIPITVIIYLLKLPLFISIFVFLLLIPLLFLILLKIPAYNINKLGSKMESEVAVTGRRLLIQLESGKSLVNALINLGTKYKKGAGRSIERIAYNLYMGKPLEETIDETIKTSPSRTFKKIFIQIRNSLKTGADLKHTLKATLEEITRAKIVEFKTFSNKLNPLGLFYMIFGTIAPSLGVVIFVILLAILRIKITFGVLSFFLVLVLLVQLMFIRVFSKIRPRLEI